MTVAKIDLWGSEIGTIVYDDRDESIKFSYNKEFIESGIELSPIKMPLNNSVYSFLDLKSTSFNGLPGLFADSLPDTFGNYLINEYLSRQGRPENSMNPVEKLLYVGNRGPGALEYRPATQIEDYKGNLEIDELTNLIEKIITQRENLIISTKEENAMEHLIQIGSSAGGSRAKINIAWNEKENIIRSGQINAGEGFSYWILKFDSAKNNEGLGIKPNDREYTKIEYAYYLMATSAGINMSECRLLKDGECSHFITKRFDRTDDYQKIFMQSLAAIGHFDYRMPRTNSYEQMARVMNEMNISQSEKEQMFKRIIFNDLSKNYDDHVKNFGFIMNKQGEWHISPAYDVSYVYNPNGKYAKEHQMTMNNKSNNLRFEDFVLCAKQFNITEIKVKGMIEKISDAISKWPIFAQKAELSEKRMIEIKDNQNEIM